MGEQITIQALDVVRCDIPADARARIAAAARGADALVEALRIKLASVGAGTTLAQVNAEVDGRRIRVQQAAASLGEALDRLADGLRERIATVTGSWIPRPWPQGTGAHALPSALPGVASRITRVKAPSLVWCQPDAAVRTMDAMDYDIHLFTDPATECDAVVYRVGPTGYRLARTRAAAPPDHFRAPMTLSPHSAPCLTEQQAVQRMQAAELPFLFFAHPGSGSGRVLYRRFDGHLGLIAGAR